MATANPNNVTQGTQDPPAFAHNAVIFDGTLPGPANNVANIMHQTDAASQRTRSSQLFDFLMDNNSNLSDLNSDDTPHTVLINIPNSSKVKLLYCGGVGASGIGQATPTDGKFLWLQGDGGPEIGTPHPFVLPTDMRQTKELGVMTLQQFSDKLRLDANGQYTWPLLQRAQINTKATMLMAPIPPYLVYDGIDNDLDAADVLERLLSLSDEVKELEVIKHATNFLLSCLYRHNQGDPKPFISQDILLAPVPIAARRWATAKFQRAFPSLQPAVTPPHQEINNNLLGGAPNAQNLQQLLRLLGQPAPPAPAVGHPPTNTSTTKEDDNTTFGMSHKEVEATLVMCGELPLADPSLLPEWFKLCAEKGTTEQF